MPEPSSPDEDPSVASALAGMVVQLADCAALADGASNHASAALLRRLAFLLAGLAGAAVDETDSLSAAAESLELEIHRARAALRSCSPGSSCAVAREAVRDLARSAGALIRACPDAPPVLAEELKREVMEFGAGGESDGATAAAAAPDLDDLMSRIRSGGDEHRIGEAIDELGILLGRGLIGEEGQSAAVMLLVTRLGLVKNGNRRRIIVLLRSLAKLSDGNKELMASTVALSNIVRSLSRDANERREAVGLLLELSEVLKVRQKIGKLQGCIVMLVVLLNGDDVNAARDAGRLLGALSGNTQNVLLMAEAGFFVPLVQYLKEGSDMDKILMASAISKMELSDQRKVALGEEGSIEPLVGMFNSWRFEAKLSALGALRNLSSVLENIPRSINAGIIAPLLQLLFSVTSILMTLQEPASAILASLARSELILTKKNAARQMLSLLNLSSPAIQYHLLQALDRTVRHPGSYKIRAKMKENGAVQLLLPFLIDSGTETRIAALNFLCTLSSDCHPEIVEHLGEPHLYCLANIVSTSSSENERAAAVGVLNIIPLADRRTTDICMKKSLIPVLISLVDEKTVASSLPMKISLIENIAGLFVRFTDPSDKKLQKISVAHGLIPCLLTLLQSGSAIAKARAATSLSQLAQSSLALIKADSSRCCRVPQSSEAACDVHNVFCSVKGTFCLFKAGAITPLIQILEGKDSQVDEAVLSALATLMQDEIWEPGSSVIEKASGVPSILKVLEFGSPRARGKALWILERIFRLPEHREKYSEASQMLLIDLAQDGDPALKPLTAKILAHLELLQVQSSYF